MFTVSQKQTIEQALTQCKVTFDSITFSSNHKVTIKQAVAPSAALQAGCFRQLKPIAWRISDAIGAGEEVDYFATGNTAIFTLKVDLGRAQRQATPRPVKVAPVRQPKAVVIVPEPVVEVAPEPAVILTAQGFQETATFTKGEVVWVAVMFQGKPVRIKAEVVKVIGGEVTVISNRTQLVYHVASHLVFAEKPSIEVLELV